MPTYEYGCTACGKEWEEIQRISEPPIEVCPACGKSAAHRLISAGTGFILKGGGWYSDLYSSAKPSGGKTESSTASTSESSGKTGGTGGGSESKSSGSETKSGSSDAKSSGSTSTTSTSTATSSS